MNITNHRLEDADYIESPNQGGPYAPGALDTIVIHFTAGASAESAIETLCNVERRVSAHLVVGRNGTVTQLLPFNIIGWHAGRSKWGEREGFNKYSIGIEIDNAGELEERDGRYESWFGRAYPEEEIVRGIHRHQTVESYWHRFTPEQLRVVEALCAALIAEYGIQHILGHEEIAPDRKVDPGPAFPLDQMRARLLEGPTVDAGPETATVKASRLNIRAAPNGQAERLAGHLFQGTEVEVLEEQAGWCKVKVELEGWVAKRYLERT
jgi:N-acetylmuramoyl-L-alanine amidase